MGEERATPKPIEPAARPASDVMLKRNESGPVESLVRRAAQQHGQPTRVAEQGIESYRSLVDEMRRLYAEGEVEAALDIASTVRPSSLGFSLAAIPVVAMSMAELLELPLDHRAGFLLARIDGRTDLKGVLDIAAMPGSEATAILEELLALGAIRLSTPGTFADMPTPTSPSCATPSPSPPPF